MMARIKSRPLCMFSVVHYLHVHVHAHKVSIHKVRFTHVYTTGNGIFCYTTYHSTPIPLLKEAYIEEARQRHIMY